MSDHVRVHGVEDDVSADFREIRILLNEQGLEAALEEMAGSFVSPIEPGGVCAIQPLHTLGKVGLRSLNDQMKVIVHQHPGGDAPAEATNSIAKEAKEGRTVAIVIEDVTPFISSRCEVVGGSWEFNAYRSCHGPRIPRLDRFASKSTVQAARDGQKLLGMESLVTSAPRYVELRSMLEVLQTNDTPLTARSKV